MPPVPIPPLLGDCKLFGVLPVELLVFGLSGGSRGSGGGEKDGGETLDGGGGDANNTGGGDKT